MRAAVADRDAPRQTERELELERALRAARKEETDPEQHRAGEGRGPKRALPPALAPDSAMNPTNRASIHFLHLQQIDPLRVVDLGLLQAHT